MAEGVFLAEYITCLATSIIEKCRALCYNRNNETGVCKNVKEDYEV